MSAREIIEQLPGLTAAELQAVEQRISELISRAATATERLSDGRVLHAERIAGRLVLTGPGIVRQAEVAAVPWLLDVSTLVPASCKAMSTINASMPGGRDT